MNHFLPLFKWYDNYKFYKNLDVYGKIVYDIGENYGKSPIFFIQKGAESVYGISTDNAILWHEKYHQSYHRKSCKEKRIKSCESIT